MMGAVGSTPESAKVDRSTIDDLVDAMETERRLLDDMSAVLVRQREGVSGGDLGVLDESVYSAQRILLTLRQARQRRRTLLRLLGGHEDGPLSEIELAFGPGVTPAVRKARDDLLDAAGRLARASDVNRRVIEGAVSVGAELMSLLMGHSKSTDLYSPKECIGTGIKSGALINTKA